MISRGVIKPNTSLESWFEPNVLHVALHINACSYCRAAAIFFGNGDALLV